MSLCAICVQDGDCHREVIDDKLVNVCSRCAGEHPRAGGYAFEANESRDQRQNASAQGMAPGCRRKNPA